ncbi:hypothetical protein [Micromonospora yangpuensis]|uniref:hypothetical protein n=1 Tax=Micromonospora yangpuensis TaxID=683228 RepID=UPI000A746DFF|nr:hypothetical protein [Micromonospora yangpuensis]GGM16309.1 hypothetical protein GCM10012279_38030 [Micromonospora yangpuensis]
MAEQGGQSGPMTEVARQAADRVHGVAGWLEERQPGDILTEVRDYARRNPGTFLVGAAVLGVLAGRLTRNISAASNGSGNGAGAVGQSHDPEATAVIPTSRGMSDAVPPGGYLDPTPGTFTEPTPGFTDEAPGYPDPNPRYADPAPGYADPAPGYGDPQEPRGTGQPLPPVSQTDPLPGVPSSASVRP